MFLEMACWAKGFLPFCVRAGWEEMLPERQFGEKTDQLRAPGPG